MKDQKYLSAFFPGIFKVFLVLIIIFALIFKIPATQVLAQPSLDRVSSQRAEGSIYNNYHQEKVKLSPAAITNIVTATDQSHTSDNNVVIGEIATYTVTLTVPEGSTPNARMNETLPDGLAFVDCISVVSSSTDLTTDLTGGFTDACNDPTNPEITSDGHGVAFNIGNLTNADANSETAETVTIVFTVVVLNISSNQQGTTLGSTAYFSWDSGLVNASSSDLSVVEPALIITKTSLPEIGDAGDSITFTIVVENPVGGVDAFNVSMSDVVPSETTYTTDSFQNTSGLAPTTISDTTDLFAQWDSFPAGSSSTLTFSATLNATVTPGDQVSNFSILQFTSLAGAPGQLSTYNSSSYERTGASSDPGGESNDYIVNDPAYVDISVSTPVKYLVYTSEPDDYTSGTNLSIGEIVRYRLAIAIPEGSAVSLQIRDLLPAGAIFLDDDTARLAFVSNSTGITSSTITCTNDTGSAGDPTSLPAAQVDCTFPDGSITNGGTTDPFTSGSDPWFGLGDLTNADDDSDQEFILIEFNALVLNESANPTGMSLGNNFRVYENGTQVAESDSLSIVVVEPEITVNKTVSSGPYDAGDTLTYSIVVSNGSGTYSTSAFNIQMDDAFDSALDVQSVTVTVPAYAAYVDNTVDNAVSVTIDRLDPGDSATIDVDALVLDTVPALLSIPNTADVEYTSLTGANGTSPNSTGSSNTGTPGEQTGERTGQDGSGLLNDYVYTEDEDITIGSPSIDKHTPSPTEYTIGETVVYPVTITLPEGITQGLQVEDEIPDGMEYVSYETIITAADSSGLLTEDFSGSALSPTVSAPGGSGGNLTLVFGDVTTTADITLPAPDNNTFLVEVTARVLDIPANVGGGTLDNSVMLYYTNPNDLSTVTLTDGPETITLIEPAMEITKTFDPEAIAINETTQVTLVVLNSGTSPAYDVVIEDSFPMDTFQSLVEVTTPVDFTYQAIEADPNRTVSYSGGPIEAGGSRTFVFNATLASSISGTLEYLNTAIVSQATTLDGESSYERDEPDVEGTDTLSGSTPDLVLDKDDSLDTASPGDTLVYTITIDNNGTHDSGALTLTDTIPDGTVFDSASSDSGWDCSDGDPAGTVCSNSLIGLTSGGQTLVFFALRVNDSLDAGITQIANSAQVVDDGTYGEDPTPDNNEHEDIDTITGAEPQMTIEKTDTLSVDADSSGLPSPGDTIHYVVTITNSGSQDAGDGIFSDTPDANTALVVGSVTTTQGNITLGNVVGDTSVGVNLGEIAALSGSATIEFDVTINDPLVPEDTFYLENQGVLSGTNFSETSSDDPDISGSDDPTRTILEGLLSKSLVDTNQTFTSGVNVAIGEIVEYEIDLQVPSGTASDVNVTDILDSGLAFVDCVSITPDSTDLTTDLTGGFDDACANPQVDAEPSGNTDMVNQGRSATFALGNLTNSSTGNVALRLLYRAVILNDPGTLDGDTLTNEAGWVYDGLSMTASADAVAVIEPDMQIVKTVDDTTVTNNQVVTFTLSVSHTAGSNANAFDLELTDTLPDKLVYEAGSLQQISGTAATTLDDSDTTSLVITWDEFPLGGTTAVIQFQVRVSDLDTGDSTDNYAFLSWTSLPGDVESAQSTYNDLSTERFYDPPSGTDMYGVSDSVTLQAPSPTTTPAPVATQAPTAAPIPTAVPTRRPTPTFPATK